MDIETLFVNDLLQLTTTVFISYAGVDPVTPARKRKRTFETDTAATARDNNNAHGSLIIVLELTAINIQNLHCE